MNCMTRQAANDLYAKQDMAPFSFLEEVFGGAEERRTVLFYGTICNASFVNVHEDAGGWSTLRVDRWVATA